LLHHLSLLSPIQQYQSTEGHWEHWPPTRENHSLISSCLHPPSVSFWEKSCCSFALALSRACIMGLCTDDVWLIHFFTTHPEWHWLSIHHKESQVSMQNTHCHLHSYLRMLLHCCNQPHFMFDISTSQSSTVLHQFGKRYFSCLTNMYVHYYDYNVVSEFLSNHWATFLSDVISSLKGW